MRAFRATGIGATVAAALAVAALGAPVADDAPAAIPGAAPAETAPTPAPAPPAPDVDRLARVERQVSRALAWMSEVGEGETEITLSKPIQVSAVDHQVEIVLPGVALIARDGGVEIARWSIGSVVLRQTDRDDGSWRLTGALPHDMTITIADEPATADPLTAQVTVDRSEIVWEGDPEDGFSHNLSAALGDLAVAIDVGRLAIGSLTVESHLETVTTPGADPAAAETAGADPAWTAPTHMELVDLAIIAAGTPPQTIGALDRLVLAGRAAGGSLARLRQVHRLGNRLAEANPLAVLGTLVELFTVSTEPSLLVSGVRGEIALSGLAAGGSGLGGRAVLAEGALDAAVSRLDTDDVRISLGYRHDGLEIGAEPADQAPMTPPAATVELALDHLPLGSAIALIGDLVSGASGAGAAAAADPAAAALDLVGTAGSRLEIGRFEVAAPAAAINLAGHVAADASSPYFAVADLDLRLTGLDAIATALETVTGEPPDPVVVAVISALGATETGTPRDGDMVARRYHVTLGADGRAFLNDTDVTPVFEQILAELAAEDAPPPPAAAAAGDDGLLTALTPAVMIPVLEEIGFAPSLRPQDGGFGILVSRGTRRYPVEQLFVVFGGCDAPDGCTDALIWSWFTPRPTPSFEAINDWNADSRWVRAYLDRDRDLRLEIDLHAGGGLGHAGLEDLIGSYLERLSDLIDRFGPRAP